MTIEDYSEDFYKKYSEDVEDGSNEMYEYKTGEFFSGEIIGMQTIPVMCNSTKYQFEKDTTQEYIPIAEFVGEEGCRENDLQVPYCGDC